MSRKEISTLLANLLDAQFEKVLLLYEMPPEYLRRGVARSEQSSDLIRYAEQREEKHLPHLRTIIEEVIAAEPPRVKPPSPPFTPLEVIAAEPPRVKPPSPSFTRLLVLLIFLLVVMVIGLMIYHNELFSIFFKNHQTKIKTPIQIEPEELPQKTPIPITELQPESIPKDPEDHTLKLENNNNQPIVNNNTSVSVNNKNNNLPNLPEKSESPLSKPMKSIPIEPVTPKNKIIDLDDAIPDEYSSLTVLESYRITALEIEAEINQKPEPNLWILKWSGTGNQENFWRYELLRRTPSTPWKVISTFNRMQETTYSENLDTLKPWETYYYQVIPILEKHKTRGVSKTVTRITPLLAPTRLLLAQMSEKVRLIWEWSSTYPVKHFAVYKFKYTPYAKLAYEKGNVKVVKQATVTSLEWEDQIATGCQSDYYLVRAIDDRNQEGIETAPVNIPLSIVYSEPLNFRRLYPYSNDFMRLEWDGVQEDECDLKNYYLEARIGDSWKFLDEIPSSEREYRFPTHGENISALRLNTINKSGQAGKAACCRRVSDDFSCKDKCD